MDHEKAYLVVPHRRRHLRPARHRIHSRAQRGPPAYDDPRFRRAHRRRGLSRDPGHTFMFGLEMMVIGAFLVYASQAPRRHLNLVWLIVGLELVRGIFHDMYMISQGYDPAFMLGFTLLHIVVIGTGILFTRATKMETGSEMTARLSSDGL
ncbi:MAG: hypothetical protein D6775_16245 [Caldilineae bacterium]|nr:MAG: hypothetical protein D6775_16245 [Caldilineae bacterium]